MFLFFSCWALSKTQTALGLHAHAAPLHLLRARSSIALRSSPFVSLLVHTQPGPGYRNVVGLPGGVQSPYFKLLQEANVNGMELREGRGNVYEVGSVCVRRCALRMVLRQGSGSQGRFQDQH